MKINYQCKYRANEEIQTIVNDLLHQHFHKIILPIDVELFAEYLGIEIVPITLPRNIDALLNSKKQILVSAERYTDSHFESRNRFSIAHELGHFILHQDTLQDIKFR